MTRPIPVALSAVLAVVLIHPVCAGDAIAPRLGIKLDDFTCQDFRGATHSLSDYEQSRIVVVAFLGVDCPIARLYAPRLAHLAKEYAAQGVQFLALDPNRQDAVTEMGYFAKEHGIEFPFLKDLNNRVADALGAARVPQMFVLDRERIVRYAGRIDDEYGFDTGSGYAKTRAKQTDLINAIDALLAGKQIAVSQTRAIGCLIGRVRQADPTSEVTYSNQIARIFQDRCVDCHRPGQIGPFALQSYDEAVGWAEMIREVVAERRMPPWHADPAVGKWKYDLSLSQAEKDLIDGWVTAGAPEGNPKDLPEPRQYVERWMMPGGPDAVFYMTEAPVSLKAEGAEPYHYYTVDTNFSEDKWVSVAECMPGNRSVVHHIIVTVRPPSSGDETPAARRSAQNLGNHLVGYAPGTRPVISPPGYARLIPAGSRLTFQMHYTPNGTPQQDRSCVGLKFVDASEVQYRLVTANAANASFVIPPAAPNYEVESFREFRRDVQLMSLFAHMHVRGKDFRYEVTYPDGTSEALLNMPRYDFNWQTSYVLLEPKRLPAGTRMHCTAHFDNSADNPANPDPTIAVRFGEQTWDEMMIGWFDYSIPKDINPADVLSSNFGGRQVARSDAAE